MSWFDYTFLHLEYLDVEITNVRDFATIHPESVTERLLKKNPQIRTLVLRMVPPKMLKIVADLVPNLENLQINFYLDEEDANAEYTVHFDNLKMLSIRQSSRTMPKNVYFENLIELEVDATESKCLRWLEFVEKSKSLVKLRVTDRYLCDEEISRLAMARLNLTELSAGFDRDVKDETIIQLIEMSKNLRKMELIKFVVPTESTSLLLTAKTLREKIGNQWNIADSPSEIFIERMF